MSLLDTALKDPTLSKLGLCLNPGVSGVHCKNPILYRYNLRQSGPDNIALSFQRHFHTLQEPQGRSL
jgi:hypothetical protein